ELAWIEDTMDIDPHDAVKIGAIDVEELMARRNPGIADENIEPAERCERARKSLVDVARVRHIDNHDIRKQWKLGFDRRPMIRAAAPHANLGTLADKAPGDGRTDPGRASGEDHPLALQSPQNTISFT